MSYNGWSNYETWLVALWIDNDMGLYDEVRDMARSETDAYNLGESIKGLIDELQPEVTGMFADLMNSALSEVNWTEIAEHHIEEEPEEETEAE